MPLVFCCLFSHSPILSRHVNQYDVCGWHRPLCSPGLLHQAVEKPGHSGQLLRRPLLPAVCVSAPRELVKRILRKGKGTLQEQK